MEHFPDNAGYMLWRGKENRKAQELLDGAGITGTRVFEAYAGKESKVKFTILRLEKINQ